ncbi:two pore domain potassium channel family protein [Candidatus Micrarchaeota archaeon]|nr:two pore domain potassium channel family protein [Candidatus Micrarchaeota archaeon]
MNKVTKDIFFALVLLAIIYTGGTVFYHTVEGWDWLDSIYFMTATVTTVGYGDIIPFTREGKLFTIFFTWIGISVGFYLIYVLTQYRINELDTKLLKFFRFISFKKSELFFPEPDEIHPEYGIPYLGDPSFFRATKRKTKPKKKKTKNKK